MNTRDYCINIFKYQRYKTSEVKIGKLKLGNNNPIAVQSMTTTNTNHTKETIDQIKSISDAGGQMARMTTQGQKEAENLKYIKEGLTKDGYCLPLVADIHFNPNAANIAAQHIEKVRINPGNFVDGAKRFVDLEYTDEEYKNEIELIKKKLIPLLNVCKENKTAIRIGTNHGSLSDRIMSRYGDTSMGMVESCMEFLRICKQEGFSHIVLSIKASNALIMVQTVRLLVQQMHNENMNFPLHLGVTEAGEGEDGRIRSAVGIGTLLSDGIGDTIRVSLTESPEKEIPVAQQIINYIMQREGHAEIKPVDTRLYSPFETIKRNTKAVQFIGGGQTPVVMGSINKEDELPDLIFSDKTDEAEKKDKTVVPLSVWKKTSNKTNLYPLASINEFMNTISDESTACFIRANYTQFNAAFLHKLKHTKNSILVLGSSTNNNVAEQRAAFLTLMNNNITCPVIIHQTYNGVFNTESQIKASCDIGPLLLDGFGDGVWIETDSEKAMAPVNSTLFSILQAARVRFSKPDYISCPGCGRTLFSLQETTAKVKETTAHLKGLKIAVMGCIVNGPGEMADADYGYVGSAPGKITLYHKRKVIKKNIEEKDAVEELIQLIKDNNDWKQP